MVESQILRAHVVAPRGGVGKLFWEDSLSFVLRPISGRILTRLFLESLVFVLKAVPFDAIARDRLARVQYWRI